MRTTHAGSRLTGVVGCTSVVVAAGRTICGIIVDTASQIAVATQGCFAGKYVTGVRKRPAACAEEADARPITRVTLITGLEVSLWGIDAFPCALIAASAGFAGRWGGARCGDSYANTTEALVGSRAVNFVVAGSPIRLDVRDAFTRGRVTGPGDFTDAARWA